MGKNFECEITVSEQGVAWLVVRGDLDALSASTLLSQIDALSAADPHAVVLDCAGLAFLDSAGLSALLELRRCAELHQVSFEMRDVPAGPRRVLEVTQLLELLGVVH